MIFVIILITKKEVYREIVLVWLEGSVNLSSLMAEVDLPLISRQKQP